jgi:hypothetical protein
MNILSLIQYPAFLCTIISIYYTGGKTRFNREIGFIIGIVGCIIWIIWASSQFYTNPSIEAPIGIVITNIAVAIMSYRGVVNNKIG